MGGRCLKTNRARRAIACGAAGGPDHVIRPESRLGLRQSDFGAVEVQVGTGWRGAALVLVS